MTDRELSNIESESNMPDNQNMNSKNRIQKNPGKLRTLTRFMIGGLALATDEFANKLSEWNAITDEQVANVETSLNKDQSSNISSQYQGEPIKENDAETSGKLARYALIGITLAAENRIKSGFSLLGRFGNKINGAAKPLAKPITQNPMLLPARKQFNKLANRGQAQVSQWINMGRIEEKRSRHLVQTTFNETLDSSIEYLADNAEIQDLIQSQSTGLANEIVEEIRERTVSADTLVENILRSILRLTPRSEISGPPLEIRLRALSIHTGSHVMDETEIVNGPTPR